MKQKTFYITAIAVICCCVSLLSSAGSKCDAPPPSEALRQNCPKETRVKATQPKEYDLSPLSLFLFNI